jgi:hypothetical protein
LWTGERVRRCAAALLAGLAVFAVAAHGSAAATFGRPVVSAGSTFASPDYKFASRFTLSEGGQVSKLTLYAWGYGTSGFQSVRGLIYADAGGNPGPLVATTQEVSITYNATKGWVELALPAPVPLAAGNYWLGFQAGARFGDALSYYGYDAATAAQQTKFDLYSDGPSDPFGAGASKDRVIAVYATYAPDQATAPAASDLPSISGTVQAGRLLTAGPGTWTGTQPIAYAYRWQRCSSSGTSCLDIASASSATYLLATADVGKTIRLRVTGSNEAGSSSATSAATAVVAAKPGGDPVIAAAGDIACDPLAWNYNAGLGTALGCHQKNTSDLLVDGGYTTVLPLGDVQYECSPLSALLQSYDPTWGRVKSISRPVIGNHEYDTDVSLAGTTHTACGSTGLPGSNYFAYFGAAAGGANKGYYSYDLGTWHLIALNSNCAQVGGCGSGSPQELWLRSDLAAHRNACTLAYWHHPRFNSDSTGNSAGVQTFWQDLYNSRAELILNGHAHDYERFAPQNPSGKADNRRGLRQIVSGTGGKSHGTWKTDANGVLLTKPNSQVRNNTTFGILQLTLHPSSYDWKFVPEAGKTFSDSGSTACH